MHWLFWEVDPARVDLKRDADFVIARVVEHGTLSDVKWLVQSYGLARIHAFFRDAGNTELSARTVGFWRAFFRASNESWVKPPSWRKRSAALWPS
jgi:hypothetical protein